MIGLYLWLLLAIVILLIVYLTIQNKWVSQTTYKVFIPNLHPKVKDKKMIFLSDTHFRGKQSYTLTDQLLVKIENSQPDLILFGGDIVHKIDSEAVIEHTKDFFAQLGAIAPTYVIYGNHELGSPKLKEISGVLKRAGVTLLENEAEWFSFGEPGAGFWLMGLAEYETSITMKKDVLSSIELPEGSKNEPKILLAHHPHFFEKYLDNDQKRPDLILSGHAHGGQVILPFIGGLFSPGQGFNPTYDYGIFTSEHHPTSRLILTRGIGNSSFPFRINNRPELVTIEFE